MYFVWLLVIKTEERGLSDRAMLWKGFASSLKETAKGCKGSVKLILEAVVNSTI